MIERNEVDRNAMGGTELMGLALTEYVDANVLNKFQIIRSRVREIDTTKIPLLWLHDLPWDPESAKLRDPAFRKQFKKIVFVSHWQQQMYNLVLGVPYSEGVVIKNAIKPIEKELLVKPDPAERVNVIYHSTPHRGLNILVPVFNEVLKFHPEAHLDVYSSFKLYGWEERDDPYKDIFEKIKQHSDMTYHGTVDNKQVRAALGRAHVFAYPSTWQETSCICAVEAMSAGCLTVTSSLAALPETCANYAIMYNYTEHTDDHANMFFNMLLHAIDVTKKGTATSYLKAQKEYFDRNYDWELRGQEWTFLLNTLL